MGKMKEKNKVLEIVNTIADKNKAEVIDYTYNRNREHCFLKIVLGGIEGDYNIDLSQITAVTKAIRSNQEFEEIVPEDYKMEVTSPGSDYPMRSKKDFTRNKGQKVRLKHDNLEIKTPVVGKLIKVEDNGIFLEISGEEKFFDYQKINFGKVCF